MWVSSSRQLSPRLGVLRERLVPLFGEIRILQPTNTSGQSRPPEMSEVRAVHSLFVLEGP